MATAQQIVEGLVARGVPQVAAIGLAGNAYVESGFDTSINERAPLVKGSRGGFGLFQWTGPRRRQFEAFAKQRGADLGDVEAQLDFTAWELANTEKRAASKIMAAKTPEEAAEVTSASFLRPGIPHLSKRISAAKAIAAGTDLASISSSGNDVLIGGEGEDTISGYAMTPEQSEKLYRAYVDGTMGPEVLAQYEADVRSGKIQLPDVSAYERKFTPEQEIKLWTAYSTGQMTDDQRAAYERDAEFGLISIPEDEVAVGEVIDPTQPSVVAGTITGDELASITPPRADEATPTTTPAVSGQGLDLTREYAGEMGGKLAMAGLRGEAVDLPASLGVIERPAEGLANLGMAAIGGIGAATGAAAGLAGDVVQAAGFPGYGAGVARDLAALPEAFAGSPSAVAGRASQVAQAAPKAAPVPAAARIASGAADVASDLSPDALGALVRRASTGGMGSAKAAEELAKAAKVNPEASAAAQRLGIELPADVFSDHSMLKEAVGLTRSQAGSEASSAWRDTLVRAVDQADKAIDAMDGSPDLSSVSDQVKRSLTGTRDALRKEAGVLYDEVERSVGRSTIAEPNELVKTINKSIEELRGTTGLTKTEKEIYGLVTNPEQPVTYELLSRVKRQVGRAINERDGPYVDADLASLKRIYAAITEDQLATVARVGGDDLRTKMRVANQTYAKTKALEKRIVDAFGKDMDGGIASKLRLAIAQGSTKGDITNLNKILKTVPEDLQREALMSAISSMSRTKATGLGSADGFGFGFAEYAKLYSGMRQNSQVMARVANVVGPEATAMMRDLYEVSKRVTEARANVLTTGKANQALTQAMFAEGVVGKVLNSTTGRAVRGSLGAAAGAATSGPLGGIIGGGIGASKIGKNRQEAVSALFRSEKFQKMLIEGATNGQPRAATVRAVSYSPEFRKWAKVSNIDDPQQWLLSSLTASNVQESME